MIVMDFQTENVKFCGLYVDHLFIPWKLDIDISLVYHRNFISKYEN